MRIEIDQSGKIEDTSKDTLIAFSNGESKVVCIKARTKRRLQEKFRKIGEPRSFILRVFAAGIVLLLKDIKKNVQEVVIDKEYPGYEKVINDLILKMLDDKAKRKPPIMIRFDLIGKKSSAHIATYDARTGKRKDIILLSFIAINKLAIVKDNKNRVMNT